MVTENSAPCAVFTCKYRFLSLCNIGRIYDETNARVTFTVIEYQLFDVYCSVDTLHGAVKITLVKCGNGGRGRGIRVEV